MGSSGALTLGFALGCLGIIGGAKMATVLLVLAVPIIDVAWLIVSRIRHGKSPLQGGRDHLHFRLLDLGLSQRQIVIGYYLISALFGGLALIDRSAHLQGAGARRVWRCHADRADCGRQKSEHWSKRRSDPVRHMPIEPLVSASSSRRSDRPRSYIRHACPARGSTSLQSGR